LVAAHHHTEFHQGLLLSGVSALDDLLGGGLDRGSSTLLMGPAGVGKSTVALRYAISAAERGERVALYIFEESLPMIYARMRGLGLDLESQVNKGRVIIQKIDPAQLTPGEFSYCVQEAVEKDEVKVVVIDSLAGYMNAMPNERSLILLMHELLSFLTYRGVTSLLIVGQRGMLGASMSTPEGIDVSYLADTVLLFRYYEFQGEIRQAISVFKRRGGMHERTIRDLKLGKPEGIKISEPLTQFRGVMTGIPIYQNGNQGEK
jgi:circadian clock protein KaiC